MSTNTNTKADTRATAASSQQAAVATTAAAAAAASAANEVAVGVATEQQESQC